MPQTRNASFLEGRNATWTYHPAYERATAGALRSAFAFLRANADRRYSATVLMSLMDYADRMEGFDEDSVDRMAGTLPRVITLESPFSYDEETETKSGGLLGVAVVLPDYRVLLAVHRNNRRIHIGTFMLSTLTVEPIPGGPTFWIHQENTPGQMFALAQGMMPYEVNRQGAVMYRNNPPTQVETDAVGYMDDSEIEQRLRRGRDRNSFRNLTDGRPRRAPRFTATSLDPATDRVIPEGNGRFRRWAEVGSSEPIREDVVVFQDMDNQFYGLDSVSAALQVNGAREIPPTTYVMPIGMYHGRSLARIEGENPAYIQYLAGLSARLPFQPPAMDMYLRRMDPVEQERNRAWTQQMTVQMPSNETLAQWLDDDDPEPYYESDSYEDAEF